MPTANRSVEDFLVPIIIAAVVTSSVAVNAFVAVNSSGAVNSSVAVKLMC